MIDLDGKVFAVLGAGPGFGVRSADLLRQAGAFVACLDRDAGRARAAAAAVDGKALAADVLDERQLADTLAEARGWKGRLDGVVDIVGGSSGRWLPEQTMAEVEAELRFNLTHKFAVVRLAAAQMAQGGSMTFIGSVGGFTSVPQQTVYGAAKAGLHNLVAGAAAELGHRGIRVNAVAPGITRTPRMLERFSAAQWAEVAAGTPLQRAGEVDDVAGVILFLASPLAAYVTGQTIVVDGGQTLPYRMMRSGSEAQIRGRR